MADDGSVVVGGYTSGNWSGVNAGQRDFIAIKLDAAGEEVWVWQVRHVQSSFRQQDIPNATLRITTVLILYTMVCIGRLGWCSVINVVSPCPV